MKSMPNDMEDIKLENAIAAQLQTEHQVIPAGLLDRIFSRLEKERAQQAINKLKFQVWTSVIFFAAALSGFVLSVKSSLNSNLGSIKFLSLLFTDFSSVIHNWQDYSFSLLEALPLQSLALILLTVLASVLIGEYLITRWKNFRELAHS